MKDHELLCIYSIFATGDIGSLVVIAILASTKQYYRKISKVVQHFAGCLSGLGGKGKLQAAPRSQAVEVCAHDTSLFLII